MRHRHQVRCRAEARHNRFKWRALVIAVRLHNKLGQTRLEGRIMLVFWGVMGGLTLGAVWPGGGELTSWVGIVIGLVAGLTLRWAVRKEVRGQLAASEKKLKSELLADLKNLDAVAVAAAPVLRQEAPDGLVDNERFVLPTAPTGVAEA